MIEVEHLTKHYGSLVAVRDLSFRVGQGEVVGFLGPNGAGKSTTLRILAGFLGATSGRVRIGGLELAEEPLRARALLGYMPESCPLYPELRVREYLEFRARLKRVPRRAVKSAVSRALELAALTPMREVLIRNLSKGYRQRVGLADALVAKPPLLVLDEPTAGLDPNQIREVRGVIRALAPEHTLLLSTHILSEVEASCDRALVIDHGQLVGDGTLAELRAGQRTARVTLRLRGAESMARSILAETEGLRSVEALGARADGRPGAASDEVGLVAAFEESASASEVTERAVARLVAAGLGIREVIAERATLEDVFAALTRDDPAQRDASAERAAEGAP